MNVFFCLGLWYDPFDERDTIKNCNFFMSNGQVDNCSLMTKTFDELTILEHKEWRAICLPYKLELPPGQEESDDDDDNGHDQGESFFGSEKSGKKTKNKGYPCDLVAIIIMSTTVPKILQDLRFNPSDSPFSFPIETKDKKEQGEPLVPFTFGTAHFKPFEDVVTLEHLNLPPGVGVISPRSLSLAQQQQIDATRFAGLIPSICQMFNKVDMEMEGVKRSTTKTKVQIPRIKIPPPSSPFNLVPVLEKLGVKSLFEEGKADLTGMTKSKFNGLYAKDFLHSATMSIDEEGTVASAITYASAFSFGFSTAPPKIQEFIADQPYLFTIAEKNLNLPIVVANVKTVEGSDP